jgi:hypothetical protein
MKSYSIKWKARTRIKPKTLQKIKIAAKDRDRRTRRQYQVIVQIEEIASRLEE